MTAREYLRQALTIDQKVAALERERQGLLDSATSLASEWGGGTPVQGGGENSTEKKWVNYIDRAQEKAAEIAGEKECLLAVKLEISQRIDALPDGRKKDLLRWRYVALAGWAEIADGLTSRPVSPERVHQIHREALRLFEWTHKDFFGKS